MTLGDNPLVSYGTVKKIQGRHGTVADIVFDSSDGGFHIYIRESGGYDRFVGRGSFVQIFKTLSGAEKAAKKYLGV